MIRADRETWKAREVSRLLALVDTERHYYQEIVSSLPSGLAVLSPEFRVLSSNCRFWQILGLTSDDVLARNLVSILPAPGLRERLEEVLAAGTPQRDILLQVPAAAGSRSLLAAVSMLKPAEGSAEQEKSLLLVIEDISGLERLKPSGAPPPDPRYRDLIDDLEAVAWERDAATLDFSFVSPRAEQLLGFPVREWLTAPGFWAQHVHPEDRDMALACYRAAAGQTAPQACEYRMLASDGRLLWVRDVMGVPGDGAGKLRGLMADITAHKLREQHLLHVQRMEALGRISGRMAHEFNNLLMVITGYGQEVLEKLKPEDPVREDAQEILNAANRAADLTKFLLAYARRQVLDLQPVDLNNLIKQLEDKLRKLAGDGIVLVTELDSRLDPVKTNAAQMEQAIGNLVRNSREAISGSGSITIRTELVNVNSEEAAGHPGVPAGAYAVLSITDTGHGMDAEALSHLFEPFFSTKEPGRGTGLALAAMYGLVKQSGGYVAVSSAPAQGAAFRIYLPAAAPAAAPVEAPPPPEPPVEILETVLVVDDESSIRSLVRKSLRRSGYKVLEAESPEEALRLSDEYAAPLHLLITSMVLPHTSGRELADKLAAARPGLRVLYVFGYTDDDVALAAQLPEGSAFLQKPFALDALLHKVRDLLENTGSIGSIASP